MRGGVCMTCVRIVPALIDLFANRVGWLRVCNRCARDAEAAR